MSAVLTTSSQSLTAHDAAICVVKASTDGKKRPGVGKWKRYQTKRPDRATVERWFADDHPGVGFLTGDVSGGLEMVEFEGRFMTDENMQTLNERICAAGVGDVFARMLRGYSVTSPSDGLHMFARITDDSVPGSTKIARRPANADELADNPDDPIKTLIETRGEGGFVVTAPSHGPVHPTGRAWTVKFGSIDTIPNITMAERNALHTVFATFDESLPPPPPPPPTSDRRTKFDKPHSGTIGDSWMNAVVDHLKATTSVLAVLEHHGWTKQYDTDTRTMICRPGKDNGVSGSVNANGRFINFSTSVPFDAWNGRTPPTSYDILDVLAVYEFAGDRNAAAKEIAETTGILDKWKQEQDDYLTHNPPSSPTPPTNVNTETGEFDASVAARLGEEFWQQTPQLVHIAQAADSRVISREAVLLAVLVNVAAHIPALLYLPGPPRKGTPNLIAIATARPGAGKGSSADCANGLIPPPAMTKRIPLGTAEGFVKTFFELNPDKDERKEVRLVRHYHPVIVRTDEIGVFVQQTGRASASGEGLIAQLKQMCSGEALGFGYATDEKRLMVDPLSYRAGMICGVAPAKAAPLFDDRGGGLPERMVFALAFPEHVPADDQLDTIPDDPGPMRWTAPHGSTIDDELLRFRLEVDSDVAAVMRLEHLAQIRSDYAGSDLDVHRTYNRLRLAIVLAWLHGAPGVTMRWHEMAEQVMQSSDGARQWLLDQIDDERRRSDTATDQRHARRAATVDDAIANRQEARDLERIAKGARRIWQLVKDDRAGTVSDVRRLMRSFDVDDWNRALGHAIDNGWIIETDEDGQGARRRALTIGAEVPK